MLTLQTENAMKVVMKTIMSKVRGCLKREQARHETVRSVLTPSVAACEAFKVRP